LLVGWLAVHSLRDEDGLFPDTTMFDGTPGRRLGDERSLRIPTVSRGSG
jgi:hypothetical protein